VRRNR